MISHHILVNGMGRGGAERQISYIARLPEINQVICIEPLTEYPLPKGKQLILTKHLSEYKRYQKVVQLLTVPWKVIKIVNKKSHIICFLQISNLIGYLVHVINGTKFSISVRTNPWGYYNQSRNLKLPFFIFAYLLRKADYVISNSEETANQLNSKLNLKRPALVINNGYDIVEIDSKSDILPFEWESVFKKSRVVITVGRLYEEKGHWHLIRIFQELKKSNSDLKLIILGRGPLLNNLVALCNEYNLNTYNYQNNDVIGPQYDVYFGGFIANPYGFLKRSFLFFFTSLYEGLPNSPIESLICRLPILISNCPTGPIEILFGRKEAISNSHGYFESEVGYMFPAFSGENMFNTSELTPTEKLWILGAQKLLDNKEIYNEMRLKCDQIRQRFSFNEVMKQWQHFLDGVH